MPTMKDICSALFAAPDVKSAPLRGGNMLISEPFLEEDCFSHSVISIIDYDVHGGAMGVVLNHRSNSTVADLLDEPRVEIDVPVYIGGPLATDRLFFIHNLGADIIPGSRPYAPGLYVGGDFEAIIEYVNSGYPVDGCVRFFVGYSGWAEHQLEKEIAAGTWAVAEEPDDTTRLFHGNGDHYWHREVRALGEPYRPWRLVPRMTYAN